MTPQIDLIHGADEYAAFLFGDAKQRRKIYFLASRNAIPFFKIGSTICARKSTVIDWMAAQEANQINTTTH